MRRPPPEVVTLAVLVAVVVFGWTLMTTEPPPRRGVLPVALFPPNIDGLPSSEEALTRLVLDRPDHAAAWHKLGLVLHADGQIEQARSAQAAARDRVLEALAVMGDRRMREPWAHHLLGHIELALGEPDRARAAFASALSIHSGDRAIDDAAAEGGRGWTGWYNHACILAMAGWPERAAGALHRALDAGEIGPGRQVDTAFIVRDRDLDPVRGLPEYARLLDRLAEAEARAAEALEAESASDAREIGLPEEVGEDGSEGVPEP